jgi:hypothetical protein
MDRVHRGPWQLLYLVSDESYMRPALLPAARAQAPTILAKVFATIVGAATGLLWAATTVGVVFGVVL